MKKERKNIVTGFLLARKLKPVRHLFLWFIAEIFALQNTWAGFEGAGLLYANIANVFVFTGMIYFNIYFLVPKLLIRDKITIYILMVMITVVISIVLLGGLQGIIFGHYGIVAENTQSDPYAFLRVINAFIVLGFILIASSTVILYRHRMIHEKQKNELEELKIKSELAQLKSQLNPHFLFNMLNNANELTLENPEEAAVVLSKLNDLLRYQFNDSTQELVSLTGDIHFLTDYLNLEKVRRDKFSFVISKEGDINRVSIPPLLFISFVENAVKHNVSNKLEPYVHLYFKVKDKKLVFSCENSKSAPAPSAPFTGGIGLQNIKRRLDLLYGEKYRLEIGNENIKYKVCLTLEV